MADATANELFRDALTRRQIYLSKFSTGLATDIINLLDETERDVRLTLQDRLVNIVGRDFGPTTTSRLNVLANAIGKIRTDAFSGATDMWDSNMQEVAKAEAEFIDSALKDVSPVVVDTVMPDDKLLASLVTHQPMRGKVLSEWAENAEDADLARIMDAVKIGMAQGETSDDIVRRILGTQSLDGADGVTNITRNDLASITQTAVATFSNEARAAWYGANSDIISEEVYVATLDSRTTEQCAALDGKRFPVGQGPLPPVHWNCRSTRVAVIDGEVLGSRPAVSATEEELDGLSRTERRARVRELVGTVPASTTYSEFLERQTDAFQDSVLGPKRATLFREGGLTMDRFVNPQGNTYTLTQLRAREPEAFRRAGL